MACACLDTKKKCLRLRDNYAFSFIPIKSTRLVNFFTQNKRVVLRVVESDRPNPRARKGKRFSRLFGNPDEKEL